MEIEVTYQTCPSPNRMHEFYSKHSVPAGFSKYSCIPNEVSLELLSDFSCPAVVLISLILANSEKDNTHRTEKKSR
jgi:hypothetical protein